MEICSACFGVSSVMFSTSMCLDDFKVGLGS